MIFDKGVITNDYTVKINEQFDMIEKIALQIIRGVTATDKLEVFNKMPVDNGTTIEQAVIGLAKGYAFDPTAVDVFAKTKPNFYVRYFKDWNATQFATTVDEKELRKVMAGERSAYDVGEMIVASLTQGDYFDKYKNTKDLLKWASETAQGIIKKVGETQSLSTANGYKNLLKAIKNTVKGMTYVNSEFNTAGIDRRTNLDDIYILAPYKVITALDVDELAGVFNLDKAEIRNRIIEIDSEEPRIYIVDKNAIMLYTRLYYMSHQRNEKAIYDNYWLTVERMYAVSPLFDTAYIEYSNLA